MESLSESVPGITGDIQHGSGTATGIMGGTGRAETGVMIATGMGAKAGIVVGRTVAETTIAATHAAIVARAFAEDRLFVAMEDSMVSENSTADGDNEETRKKGSRRPFPPAVFFLRTASSPVPLGGILARMSVAQGCG